MLSTKFSVKCAVKCVNFGVTYILGNLLKIVLLNLYLFLPFYRVILIDKAHSKYVISRNIQQSSSGKRTTVGGHRLDILRTFFHQAVDLVDRPTHPDGVDFLPSATTALPKSSEMYWCSDYHKCHAYRQDTYTLCVLYTAAIPTHTMR